MIQKLTLTHINRTERTSKAGKAFTSVSIKSIEHGERFLSGFGGKWNQDWQEGDQVTVNVVEVPNPKDASRPYLNFERVDTEAFLLERVNGLEARLKKFEDAMRPVYADWKKQNTGITSAGTPIPFPTESDMKEIDDVFKNF